MKLLLVSALVAVAFGANPEIQSWDDWKATFEVTYKTKAEHDAKKAVFHENIAMIATHNALADKGLETYRLGVNQFTDLTQKEWSNMYLGGHQHFEKDYADLSNIDAPDSVDWRTKGAVTPVKNQGQCGSCWSFSTTGSIEGAVAIASGTLTSLSEQQLMDCSGAYGDHSCEGGLMDNAFKYVQANGGLDSEADYPYKMKDEACNRAKEATHVSTIKGYKDVETTEAAHEAAVSLGPVSIAIEADQSSFQHYRSGTFTGPCGDRLDHGVLTVGYTADYFIVKNSWGESWGDNGYIMMGRAAGGSKGMCGMYTSASYPLAGTVGPTPPPTTPGPTPPGPSPSMPYYEDPAKGACNTGELAIQIQGIDGAFCSPKCQGFLRKCPPAPSSFEGGQGECALQDQSGDKYCAVICDTTDANACDASLQSTCKSAGQGSVGICTYNDDSDKPLTRLNKSTLKTVHHKKISTHEE